MPKVHLNQKLVESLKPPSKKTDFADSNVRGLTLKILPSGSKSYYIQTSTIHGERIEKRFADASVLSLADARNLAVNFLSQIAQGINPFPKTEKTEAVPTVAEFIDKQYVPHIKGYKKSWQTDVSLLTNHVLPILGSLRMDEVKRHHLVELFAKHRALHAAGSTNRLIILVRYIFNLAVRWEITGVVKNPADNIPLYPDPKKLERFLTAEDAQRLFAALEQSEAPMLKYVVAMLLLTGARKNEVLQAKWPDFDFKNRIWLIEFNKTGKPRYVPLSEGAVDLLLSLPRVDGCDYPFANPKTKKPFVQIFWAWDTARKKAGMPDLRIHDLRHSFASFLVNSGRSLYEVQKLLGHSQIKTTQRYAHLAQDTLLDAANIASKSVPLQMVMPKNISEVPVIAANEQSS